MGLGYSHPSSVISKNFQHHPALTTVQGGVVITDQIVQSIWKDADQFILDSPIASNKSQNLDLTRTIATLACLVEAGLLVRYGDEVPISYKTSVTKGDKVSIIFVSYNNLEWLKMSLPSLISQVYSPLETILVDNASDDGSAEWVRDNYPGFQVVRLDQSISLAAAINLGISLASGEYFLVLNPDIKLEKDAIAQMVEIARKDTKCAAVAAKLKFMWAPAFLNGFGNYVGAISWGTDSGLGHLDLGQFDQWEQVPSACFAAALIKADAWQEIGLVDEGFPMYYEDTEWCYRARLFGYSILAAPKAVFYHAYSSRKSMEAYHLMEPIKLRQVAYGRLRFTTKLLSPAFLIRFLIGYLLEDLFRMFLAVIHGRWQHASAHLHAWNDYRKTFQNIKISRREIQLRRKISDRELFEMQSQIPIPHAKGGIPQLTIDVIENQYIPLIMAGRTRPIPEFLFTNMNLPPAKDFGKFWIKRAFRVWRNEGLSSLLHHLAKQIEFRLMQP